jgi:hypothetical protein
LAELSQISGVSPEGFIVAVALAGAQYTLRQSLFVAFIQADSS